MYVGNFDLLEDLVKELPRNDQHEHQHETDHRDFKRHRTLSVSSAVSVDTLSSQYSPPLGGFTTAAKLLTCLDQPERSDSGSLALAEVENLRQFSLSSVLPSPRPSQEVKPSLPHLSQRAASAPKLPVVPPLDDILASLTPLQHALLEKGESLYERDSSVLKTLPIHNGQVVPFNKWTKDGKVIQGGPKGSGIPDYVTYRIHQETKERIPTVYLSLVYDAERSKAIQKFVTRVSEFLLHDPTHRLNFCLIIPQEADIRELQRQLFIAPKPKVSPKISRDALKTLKLTYRLYNQGTLGDAKVLRPAFADLTSLFANQGVRAAVGQQPPHVGGAPAALPPALGRVFLR